MSSHLFTPITLRELTLANRILVSPMCQYSAVEGSATDWHMMHLGQLSLSGAGLLIIEATAVSPEGRITASDLGLYSDANEAALGRVLAGCRRYGNTKLGIQLAHAGRKASAHVPWQGGKPLGPGEGAWQTLAPSAVPLDPTWPTPNAMTKDDIARLKADFTATAKRAERLGLDLIELHAAHGYLLHEFLSPLANQRTDEYGSSLENRMRLPLEIATAVRAVWPSGKPLGARITGSDWLPDGLTPEDAVAFAKALKKAGCDYVDVSSGGIAVKAPIALGPGYQVPFAAKVRAEAGIATCAVGLIVEPRQAEAIIASGEADMVALARAFIDDPRWAWHAAEALGAAAATPPQYLRGRADAWPGAGYIRGKTKAA
jgi:2,4-dienoyl-CoA reductase-like NADH-dependent reductase (Old Yellow Enzyme family)